VSRPDLSPSPTTRISVAYDRDVDGAAEALLVVLRRAAPSDPRATKETDARRDRAG
jgi:hypothetical protein